MPDLLLAKAIAVPKKETLSEKYEYAYIPEVDMYLFSAETIYHTETRSFTGVRYLHNRIAYNHKIEHLQPDQLNYINVDVVLPEKVQTKLSLNKRCAKLTDDQIAYIKRLFKVA